MNKVFKIVFNAARGKMMVVNEATSSVQTGKKAAVTVAVVAALAAGTAQAIEIEKLQHEVNNPVTHVFTQADEVVKGKTGAESVSVTLGGGKANAISISSGELSIGNLNSFNVYGSGGSNAVTVQHDGVLNMNVGTFHVETAYDDDFMGCTAVNVHGGEFNLTAQKVEIDLSAGGGFLAQHNNGTVTVNADTIDVVVDGVAAGAAIYGKSDASKASVTLKSNGSLSLVSLSSSAVQMKDYSSATPTIAGKTYIDIYAVDDIYLEGYYNGIFSKHKATDSDKSEAKVTVVSETGNITIHADGDNGAYGGIEITETNLNAKAEGKIQAAKKVTISSDTGYGIKLDNADLEVIAQNIEITGATTGVNARNTSQVVLGSAGTQSVSIGVENSADQAFAMGIQVRNPDTKVTVNGEQFTVKVAASGQNATAYGVIAQGKADANKTGMVMGTLDINAQDTNITATAENGYAAGVVAMAAGKLNVNGNLTVTAEHAILARGDSVININASGKNTVKLDGDIDFAYHSTSGTTTDASVNLNLTNANSYLRGNIYTTDNNAPPALVEMTGMKLGLSNGATWYATDNSTTNYLTMNDGIVDISGGIVEVNTELSGTAGTIALGEAGSFVVTGTNNLKSALNVTQAGVNADDMTVSDAANVAESFLNRVEAGVNADGQDVEAQFVVLEGEVQGQITVGANGAEQAVNKKTEALADKVTLAPQMITRIMMNDVRKRMGDLRAAEGTHGAWARYNGGEMSGQGIDNDFHMVQVGIDTVPVADAPRFGVAFSYAQSEAKDGFGTTDMDSYSLAAYGTKMYDNGMFVDVIGRMATMDTEMVNAGMPAKMDNVALSLSGELGWRFDVTDRFFFEPSVEATYTYTNADTFMMGSNKYELEAVDSLVGRAGFAAGFKCPANKGDVYVRAAVVHEFMGDSTMNSWGADGRMAKPVEMDGKDTWFEYAIGANFNINKSTYVYADIERTEGAAMDEDWRANVGVRFAF